jgi:hypothetical protein
MVHRLGFGSRREPQTLTDLASQSVEHLGFWKVHVMGLKSVAKWEKQKETSKAEHSGDPTPVTLETLKEPERG